MLLAVFLEAMASGDRPSEFVDVGGVLDVGFFGAGELVEELFVGLVAVLAFGVILCGAWCATFPHLLTSWIVGPGKAHSGKAEASGFVAERSLTLAARRSLRSLQSARLGSLPYGWS